MFPCIQFKPVNGGTEWDNESVANSWNSQKPEQAMLALLEMLQHGRRKECPQILDPRSHEGSMLSKVTFITWNTMSDAAPSLPRANCAKITVCSITACRYGTPPHGSRPVLLPSQAQTRRRPRVGSRSARNTWPPWRHRSGRRRRR